MYYALQEDSKKAKVTMPCIFPKNVFLTFCLHRARLWYTTTKSFMQNMFLSKEAKESYVDFWSKTVPRRDRFF